MEIQSTSAITKSTSIATSSNASWTTLDVREMPPKQRKTLMEAIRKVSGGRVELGKNPQTPDASIAIKNGKRLFDEQIGDYRIVWKSKASFADNAWDFYEILVQSQPEPSACVVIDIMTLPHHEQEEVLEAVRQKLGGRVERGKHPKHKNATIAVSYGRRAMKMSLGEYQIEWATKASFADNSWDYYRLLKCS